MIRMRAVDVIEAAVRPSGFAKLSMRTPKSLGRQMLHVHGRLNGLADIVDQPLDQRPVVALGHDPDQRLGARRADHQAALALKLGLGGRDRAA